MADVPLATDVANPVVEIVATAVLLDAQVAEAVTSSVVESVKVATALNSGTKSDKSKEVQVPSELDSLLFVNRIHAQHGLSGGAVTGVGVFRAATG